MDTTIDDTTSAAAEAPNRARTTRAALLKSAAEEFHTAGYQGASLTEIAAGAGVTKGALYFHFPNKRAVADAVIAETSTIRVQMVAAITARGLDPLDTLLAESDQVVTDLIHHPIVRGGNRLLRDPLLRTAAGAAECASRRYRHSQLVVLTQLDAAAAGGLLRPGLDPARYARSIVATITGHQMICDLTHTDADLWDRVSEMWQDLLPTIAAEAWLEHWRAGDWPHRPRPATPARP